MMAWGLVIMDSPTFRSRASADAMLVEQARRHALGAEPDGAVKLGQGYLVADDLRAIGRRLGVEFRYYPTRAGLSWTLRRQWAAMKLRREPASFGLWVTVTPS
jgi:hypothetical protein